MEYATSKKKEGVLLKGGPQPTARYGPAARRPGGPAARRPSGPRQPGRPSPDFPRFFGPAVNPRACTDLHRVWACKMNDGEFEFAYHFFPILIIISILFDPFFCYMDLSEKRSVPLCLFVCLQNPIERKPILKRSTLFSNHSLRFKIS